MTRSGSRRCSDFTFCSLVGRVLERRKLKKERDFEQGNFAIKNSGLLIDMVFL